VIQALEPKPASLFIIRSMFKLFRRKPKARDFWLSLESTVPTPTCPVHGDRCGQIQMPDGVWVIDYRPCEALEGAIRRAEFSQTHEAVFNPTTNDFDIYPR
jgi:hypothetical protein